MDQINMLLTAVGCPGGPSIIQSLRQDKSIRIVGVDMNPNPPSKYLVDAFHAVPPGRDDSYIPEMLRIVEQDRIDVLLPLATFELQALAENKHQFEKLGCKVCVSDPGPLAIANDRFQLYLRFADRPFVPGFRRPSDWPAMATHLTELGHPDRPVVVKPFVSHGSIGLRIVDECLDAFEMYRNHKPSSIVINKAGLAGIFDGQSFDDILMTEYLPGREFGVDLLLDPKTHKVVTGIVRDNGEVSLSAISSGCVVNNEAFLAMGTTLAEDLGLSYAINIDLKLDQDGQPKLMEINPRMPATSFLAFSAGFNMPLLSVYQALGKPIEIPEVQEDVQIHLYRGFLTVYEGCVRHRS